MAVWSEIERIPLNDSALGWKFWLTWAML